MTLYPQISRGNELIAHERKPRTGRSAWAKGEWRTALVGALGFGAAIARDGFGVILPRLVELEPVKGGEGTPRLGN